MSGVVSYNLLNSKFSFNNCGFTPEGGYYQTFINNTGVSKKGTIVTVSTTIDGAVDIAPVRSVLSIGVIYEDNIPNGLPVKVVVHGKAYVLIKNGLAATRGLWCGTTDPAGRFFQDSSPGGSEALQVGIALESKAAGTDVLVLLQLQVN